MYMSHDFRCIYDPPNALYIIHDTLDAHADAPQLCLHINIYMYAYIHICIQASQIIMNLQAQNTEIGT